MSARSAPPGLGCDTRGRPVRPPAEHHIGSTFCGHTRPLVNRPNHSGQLYETFVVPPPALRKTFTHHPPDFSGEYARVLLTLIPLGRDSAGCKHLTTSPPAPAWPAPSFSVRTSLRTGSCVPAPLQPVCLVTTLVTACLGNHGLCCYSGCYVQALQKQKIRHAAGSGK